MGNRSIPAISHVGLGAWAASRPRDFLALDARESCENFVFPFTALYIYIYISDYRSSSSTTLPITFLIATHQDYGCASKDLPVPQPAA